MTEQTISARGSYEPFVTLQLLPRCPACHTKHPLAYNPPRDAATCPECGGPAATPGEPHTERAEFTSQRKADR